MIPYCTYGHCITRELWWFQCDELTHCNFLYSVHRSRSCIQRYTHANSCVQHAHNASLCLVKLVTSISPEHSDLHGRLNKTIKVESYPLTKTFRVLFIDWLTLDWLPNCVACRALLSSSANRDECFGFTSFRAWILSERYLNLKVRFCPHWRQISCPLQRLIG
jgi:hypothetical protein